MPQSAVFDPSKPYTEVSGGAATFDPSKPYTEVTAGSSPAAPIDQLGEAWQAAKDLVVGGASMIGHGANAAFGHPEAFIEDLKGLIASHVDQASKAKEAFTASANPNQPTGQRVGQALLGVSHGLAAATPMIGPMGAGIAEDTSTGHYGRAAVNFVGAAAPEAMRVPAVRGAVQTGVKAGVMTATDAAESLSKAWGARQATKAAKPNVTFAINLEKALGPTGKNPVESLRNTTRAQKYLAEAHEQSPIETIEHTHKALNDANSTIEGKVTDIVKAFPNEVIATNPYQAAKTALQNMRGLNATDVAKGLKALDGFGLDRPVKFPRADDLRARFNAENQSILRQNVYDRANVRATSPAFVAMEAAADALRDGLYDGLEAKGVPGVRDLRLDQGAVIALRNNAQRQIFNGSRQVTGTGKLTLPRRAAAAAVRSGSAALGGYVGGQVAGWPGAIGGVAVGQQMGQRVANTIARSNLTRDALVAKAFEKLPGAKVTFPAVPPVAAVRGPVPMRPTMARGYLPAAVAPARPMPGAPDTSYVRAVRGQYPPKVAQPVRGYLPPAPRPGIPLPAAPDASYVRSVPAPAGFGARATPPPRELGLGQTPEAIGAALTDRGGGPETMGSGQDPRAIGAALTTEQPYAPPSSPALKMPRDAAEMQQFIDAPVPPKFSQLNLHERREVKRILAELEEFKFDQPGRQTVRPGEMEPDSPLAGERQPNAPVYHALQGNTKRTSGQIRASMKAFINGGRATKIIEDVVREARREIYTSTEAAPRLLPADAGEPEPMRVDPATEFAFGANARQLVRNPETGKFESVNVGEVYTDMRPKIEPTRRAVAVDVLPTGEAQPRLPGDVGAVRETEVAQPQFPRQAAAPEDFDLTGEAAPYQQPRLTEEAPIEAPKMTAASAGQLKDLKTAFFRGDFAKFSEAELKAIAAAVNEDVATLKTWATGTVGVRNGLKATGRPLGIRAALEAIGVDLDVVNQAIRQVIDRRTKGAK